jgi:multimeric flavodoxin WrbA
MKITILNGNPDANNDIFDGYLEELSSALVSESHIVTILNLRDMDIRYCVGCLGCWLKTPGKCVVADGSYDVCREYINSDFVLFASPIIMGFTSALIKKAHDKLIALLLPYIAIYRDECHHVPRYEKYPRLGLLLEKGRDTDDEDVEIIADIYRRDSSNFHSTLCLTRLTSDPINEVANEINSI